MLHLDENIQIFDDDNASFDNVIQGVLMSADYVYDLNTNAVTSLDCNSINVNGACGSNMLGIDVDVLKDILKDAVREVINENKQSNNINL